MRGSILPLPSFDLFYVMQVHQLLFHYASIVSEDWKLVTCANFAKWRENGKTCGENGIFEY